MTAADERMDHMEDHDGEGPGARTLVLFGLGLMAVIVAIIVGAALIGS